MKSSSLLTLHMSLLFILQFVSMGAMEMSGPFWPIHLQTVATTPWLFNLSTVAVYILPMLGVMLTAVFWGRIGDKTSHKWMMIRALLGLTVTQALLSCADSVGTILILRFLQGACAGYIAPAQAYAVSLSDTQSRAKLFAYLQISTNTGSLLGAMLGGYILDTSSFLWINLLAALLCFVCAIAVYLFLPNRRPILCAIKPSVHSQNTDSSFYLLKQPVVLCLLLLMAVLLTSHLLPQSTFPLYLQDIMGMQYSTIGLCYGLQAIGFITSATVFAHFFAKKTLKQTVFWMLFVTAGCGGLTLLLSRINSANLFLMGYFFWGILLGATTPIISAKISSLVPQHSQGFILGIINSAIQFGSIFGVLIGG